MGVVGDLVSRFRQKYPSVQPKPREVVGQVLVVTLCGKLRRR